MSNHMILTPPFNLRLPNATRLHEQQTHESFPLCLENPTYSIETKVEFGYILTIKTTTSSVGHKSDLGSV